MISLETLKDTAKYYAPQVQPEFWLSTSLFCLFCSLGLLGQLPWTSEDEATIQTDFPVENFLVYSFVSRFLLIAVVASGAAWDTSSFSAQETQLEFVVAIIFAASSLEDVHQWRLSNRKPSLMRMKLELVLNATFYLHESFELASGSIPSSF